MHELEVISSRVVSLLPRDGRALVAVDGVGASGKSTFAATLAECIPDRPVVILHADDFFEPSAVRHARGRFSPEGFWLDAYNCAALVEWALVPLSADGDGWYRPRSFDPVGDRTVLGPLLSAPTDAVVLVEGTFLLRDELVRYWDCSIFLDVPADEAAQRMSARDGVGAELLARYADAQRLYDRAARPAQRATLVVDNADPAAPRLVRGGVASSG